jgi:hypothetical protein
VRGEHESDYRIRCVYERGSGRRRRDAGAASREKLYFNGQYGFREEKGEPRDVVGLAGAQSVSQDPE